MPRNVVIYTPLDPSFVGGMRSWLQSFWTRYVAERNISLRVVHTGTRPASAKNAFRKIAASNIEFVKATGTISLPVSGAPLPAVRSLRDAFNGAELVYVDNGYVFHDIMALTAAPRDTPIVSGYHSVILSGHPLHDLAWNTIGKRQVRRFSANHVLNSEDLQYIKRLGGRHVSNIPIAIDDMFFWRRELSAEFTVAFVGRFHEQKGIGKLVNIVRAASAVLPDTHFIIGGSGPLEACVRELQSLPRVRLLLAPAHEDVAHILGTSHVSLMPSRFETFGIVAAESQSAGCHVIANDVAGLRDVARVGGVSLVHPGASVDEWVTAIARLRDIWRADPDSYAAARVALVESAIAAFGYDSVATRFDTLLADANSV